MANLHIRLWQCVPLQVCLQKNYVDSLFWFAPFFQVCCWFLKGGRLIWRVEFQVDPIDSKSWSGLMIYSFTTSNIRTHTFQTARVGERDWNGQIKSFLFAGGVCSTSSLNCASPCNVGLLARRPRRLSANLLILPVHWARKIAMSTPKKMLIRFAWSSCSSSFFLLFDFGSSQSSSASVCARWLFEHNLLFFV